MTDFSTLNPREQVEYLRAANANLLGRIRQLSRLLFDESPIHDEWGLERRERQIFLVLLNTKLDWVSKAEIAEVIYEGLEHIPNESTIETHICHMRRKLRP